MRVCVVGASGVLGRALVQLLLRQHYSVRALARFKKSQQSFFPPEVQCRAFDLLSEGADRELPLLLADCDAVVHAATQIPSDFTAPGAWDANTSLRTMGTGRLLKGSLAAGVHTYIQQSISMAYPNMGENWIDENVPLDTSPERADLCSPVIAMENAVQTMAGDSLRWCILRGGVFVGKGTFQDAMMARMLARQEIVPGDGQNFISLVHAEDMASAILAAVRKAPHASVFNINADPIRQADYFDSLAAAVGAPSPPRDPAKQNAPSFRCSNAAARSVLDWQPRHDLYPRNQPDTQTSRSDPARNRIAPAFVIARHPMNSNTATGETTLSLESINRTIEEAVLRKDFARLDTLYADDFLFTHGTGLVQTKGQWLDSLRSDETRFLSRQLNSTSIELHAETAIVTGQLLVCRQSETGQARYGLQYVRVYSLKTGLWQLISHRTTSQWET